MNESDVATIRVPPELRAGVWADHVDVFGDVDELTLDFARFDPRDRTRGELVARVTASRWCILKLHEEIRRRSD